MGAGGVEKIMIQVSGGKTRLPRCRGGEGRGVRLGWLQGMNDESPLLPVGSSE